MSIHIILGNGEGEDETPQAVINESLRDVLTEDSSVVTAWQGRPFPALEKVYDYLFDHKVPTVLIHESDFNVPKAFHESDHFVVQTVPALPDAFAKEYTHSPGKFMILGEGAYTDGLGKDTYDTIGTRPTVLDLGNGLLPLDLPGEMTPDAIEKEIEEAAVTPPGDKPEVLEVKDEDPTVNEAEVSEGDDPDPFSFAREELLSMPYRVLRRLAEQVVDADKLPTGTALEPLVDAIEDARDVMDFKIEVEESAALVSQVEHKTVPDVLMENPVVHEEDVAILLQDAHRLVDIMMDGEPSHPLSMTLLKIEEALLWYHYGDGSHPFDN